MSNFSFLIIGAGRGGTSLLTGLLDAHSKLEVGMERHSVKTLMHRQVSLIRNQLTARTEKFYKLCEKDAKAFPNKVYGNKITSEQLAALHDVAKDMNEQELWDYFFHDVFKNQKVISLMRDGRTCVASKMKRVNVEVNEAVKRWKYMVRLHQYFSKQSKDRFFTFSYEDLLSQPTEELTRLCKFLDIDYETSMEGGTQSDKMLTEYRQTGIIKEKAEIKKEEDWHKLLSPELEEMGYLS